MSRQFVTAAAVVLLGTAMAACGKSAPAQGSQASPQPSAPPTSSASPTPDPAAAIPPPSQNRVSPVESSLLVPLIPDLPGWTRTQPRGELSSAGVLISKAEAEYSRGDGTIKLEITDSTFHQLIMAPLSIMLSPKYSEVIPGGYKKYAAVNGQPGFESWQNDARDGEVTVVVANRFIVNARGLNVPSIEPVRAVVRAIDLRRLGALK